jgi:hypothetical protein
MSPKHFAAIGLATLAIGGCSVAPVCASDAPTSRLSRYHTFFVLQGSSSGNETTDRRIRSDIETAINARGWVDVPRDEAQAVVVAHVATAGADRRGVLPRMGRMAVEGLPRRLPLRRWSMQPGTLWWTSSMRRAKSRCGAASLPLPLPIRTSPATRPAGYRENVPVVPSSEPTGDEALPVGDGFLEREHPPDHLRAGPAVLVQVDGTPGYQAIEGTDSNAVNARPFIVRDEDAIHYMRVGNGWMQSYTLTGMWSVAARCRTRRGALPRRVGSRRQRRSICSRVPAWTPRWIRER